jgi:hypothetical protein
MQKNNGPTVKRLTMQQQAFFTSEAGMKAKLQLKSMVNNPASNTRHLLYLSEHPKLNTQHYLSNLRLKTKINR